MDHKAKHPIGGNRVLFLDNLRTFMIFLVVLLHAGIVYESSGIGAYFWIVDDPAVNDLSGLLNIVLDIFVMPTIFFISGYFALASLSSKNGLTFVRGKLRRLILPWAIGVLTLIPLYKVIFLFSRNLPQERWTTYFHFTNGIISQNWLWFLPILFLFNIVFLLLSRLSRVPDISLKAAIFGAFLVGLVNGMSLDILGLLGWTKIGLLDFQNERLLLYFMVFLLGALSFKREVFRAQRKTRALYLITSTTAWIPIMVYVVFLLYPWFRPGDSIVSPMIDKLIVWSSFQLSLVCLVYLAVETFRRYQDTQGKLRKELNQNAYYVYVIHVIVLGGLGLILLDARIPSLLKHLVLAFTTFAMSNLIISAVRKLATLSGVAEAVMKQPEGLKRGL